MFFKFFVFSIFMCSLFAVWWFIPFADWPVWWIGVEWSMTDDLGVAPADWNRASNETFFPGVRGIWLVDILACVWLADIILSPDIWLVRPGEPIDCWRLNLSVALWNIPRYNFVDNDSQNMSHLPKISTLLRSSVGVLWITLSMWQFWDGRTGWARTDVFGTSSETGSDWTSFCKDWTKDDILEQSYF